MDEQNFFKKYLEMKDEGEEFVVITLTQVKGSAPQNLGARMIVGESGLIYGTVGGGKVEAHCLVKAKEFLNQKSSEKKYACTWNLQKDIGMTCGGEVSFLFEVESKQTSWNIAIFGAGHVSQALVRNLLQLNCHLFVFDNRDEWIKKLPSHSRLSKRCLPEMKDGVDNLPDNTNVLCMTMGHAHDVPILRQALERSFPYVGVIGSKSKRNAIVSDLKKRDLASERIEKMICPIGEGIGNNDPAEISISIIAQLMKIRG